jgi:hypothetical protein
MTSGVTNVSFLADPSCSACLIRNNNLIKVSLKNRYIMNTVKNILFLFLLLSGTTSVSYTQTVSQPLQIAVETDLLAYTTLGGFSVWGSIQKQKNRLSISYVNYPNRYRGIYKDTGIKDHDQWMRLSLWRYWSHTSSFIYGINGEYHWRTLAEDESTEEISEDDVQIGAILGYHWRPFTERETNLSNLSFSAWAGANFRVLSTREARVFEQSGSIYELPPVFEPTGGVNVIYTFYKKL